jgi:PAS domain S-box-containing protein
MHPKDEGSGRSTGTARPGLASADVVLGAIAGSVVATDHRGVVTFWNPGAEDLYGWSATEAIGRPVTALLMPEVPEAAQAEVAAILATVDAGYPWTGELRVRGKDVGAFPARISTRPIRDEAGNVCGIVGVSEDITEEIRGRLQLLELQVLMGRLGWGAADACPAADEEDFDADAAAVEIVTRAFDPELAAATNADPHATVLPASGVSLAQLDELLASLVALAVHTTTIAAERSAETIEEIVAAAALRLRAPTEGQDRSSRADGEGRAVSRHG